MKLLPKLLPLLIASNPAAAVNCSDLFGRLDVLYLNRIGALHGVPEKKPQTFKAVSDFVEEIKKGKPGQSNADGLKTALKKNGYSTEPEKLREFAQELQTAALHADTQNLLWINYVHDFVLAADPSLNIKPRINVFLDEPTHKAFLAGDFDLDSAKQKLATQFGVLSYRIHEYADDLFRDFNEGRITRRQAQEQAVQVHAMFSGVLQDYTSLALHIAGHAKKPEHETALTQHRPFQDKVADTERMLDFVLEYVDTQPPKPGVALKLPQQPKYIADSGESQTPKAFWDQHAVKDLSWGVIPDSADRIFPEYRRKKTRIELSSLKPPAKELATWAALYFEIDKSLRKKTLASILANAGQSRDEHGMTPDEASVASNFMSAMHQSALEMDEQGMKPEEIRAEMTRAFRDYVSEPQEREAWKQFLARGATLGASAWSSAGELGKPHLQALFEQAISELDSNP